MKDHWSAAYIGIPWRAHGRDRMGCDCWGLVRLVYAERGVALPSLSGAYGDALERAEIEAAISGQRGADWIEVTHDERRALDLLVFGSGWPHVGVAIDGARMLHVAQGHSASVARVDIGPWAGRLRHVGRHRAMTGEAA